MNVNKRKLVEHLIKIKKLRMFKKEYKKFKIPKIFKYSKR